MSGYALEEKQKPFQCGIKTDKAELKAEIDKSSHKIISFKITDKRKKKEVMKSFPVKRSNILKSWKEAKDFLNNILKSI
jgi:hypothetical protein